MSVPTALSLTEQLSLGALAVAGLAVVANTFQGDGAPLVASLGFSTVAFAATYAMIRWLGGVFMRAGLKGRDMSKAHRPELPETMGAVCAAVYLLTLIFFIPFPFYKDIVLATSGGGNRDAVQELELVETGRLLHRFPHSKVGHTSVRKVVEHTSVRKWRSTHLSARGGGRMQKEAQQRRRHGVREKELAFAFCVPATPTDVPAAGLVPVGGHVAAVGRHPGHR